MRRTEGRIRLDKDNKKWELTRCQHSALPRKGPEEGDAIEERMKQNLLPS